MKPILTSGEWHELKDFSRFVVSFDVQDGFVFKSFFFEHHCVEESNLVLWYFGHEFDGRVEFVSLFKKIDPRKDNRSLAAAERCVTTLYMDKNKDSNIEHTMRKFNVNSLYWLPYIFECNIGTLDNVPSTLEKIPSTLDKKADSWICCERL